MPRPLSLTSSGIALERPPAPTSWIKRIGLASPNCQQRSITSLTAALHFRVVTLYGGEIEIGIGLAGGHRRRRAAAEADIHRRAAQHDQLRADGNLALLHVLTADVADTAGQHDRFVAATQLFAIVAGDFFFIGAEVAVQRRTTKFVVKNAAAAPAGLRS